METFWFDFYCVTQGQCEGKIGSLYIGWLARKVKNFGPLWLAKEMTQMKPFLTSFV